MKSKFLFSLLAVLVIAGCTLRTSNTGSNPPVDPSPATSISQLNIYLVALEWSEDDHTGDNQVIGCNDAMIARAVKTDIAEQDKFAQTWGLLSAYDSEDSNLTNPWKTQTNISFYSYEIQDKTLVINLSGSLMLWGTCDIPRLAETLKAAYKQFGFDKVDIMINNKTWDVVTSGK